MKRFFALLGILVSTGPVSAWGATNPSALMIKILEVRLSPKTDCSESISIFRNPSATAQDFVANPSLGSGAIPNGTYHCVAIHLGDVMTITPEANDGVSCVANTPFTMDIFNTPAQGDVSIAPDGTVINGTGAPTTPSEDDPWVYFSDSPSAASSNGCFQPTLNGNSGPCVLLPVTVTGDQTRTIVVNFDGGVSDQGNGHCQLSPPVMSIR